jgi:hypothetical protein
MPVTFDKLISKPLLHKHKVADIIGGGSAHTIQEEGTSLTQRSKLNFIGTGVTATDNAGADATDVTITGGGADWGDITGDQTDVSLSGFANDLDTGDFTNNAGFITGADVPDNETDPVYSANTYAVAMNQNVATDSDVTFNSIAVTSDALVTNLNAELLNSETAGYYTTGSNINIDATGFNGNLTTDDDTVQKVAQALDDLSLGTPHSPVTIDTYLKDVITKTEDGQELGLAQQVANYVFAGPTSGANDRPTFRALLDADIPSGIDATKIGSGDVSNTEFDYLSNVTSDIQTQLNAFSSALTYKGLLDASGGSYPSTPDSGDYYVISVAGTISGTAYVAGDWAVYNGSSWDKIDNQNFVRSASGALEVVGGDVRVKTSGVTNAMLAGSIDLTSKVTGLLPNANVDELTTANKVNGSALRQLQNTPTTAGQLPYQTVVSGTPDTTKGVGFDGTKLYWKTFSSGGGGTGTGDSFIPSLSERNYVAANTFAAATATTAAVGMTGITGVSATGSTGLACASYIDATSPGCTFTTGNVADRYARVSFGGSAAQFHIYRQNNPKLVFFFRTGASISNMYIRMGTFSAFPTAATYSGSLAGLAYDSGTANFQYKTRNGTTLTTIDSGLTAAANTWYKFEMYLDHTNTVCTFKINDANEQSTALTLPAINTNLFVLWQVATKTAATTSATLSGISCEYSGSAVGVSTGGSTVKVSGTDTTANYLADKLGAGTGITLDYSATQGGDEVLAVSVDGSELALSDLTGGTYSFPSDDGDANQVLITDGSGTVAWTNFPTSGLQQVDTLSGIMQWQTDTSFKFISPNGHIAIEDAPAEISIFNYNIDIRGTNYLDLTGNGSSISLGYNLDMTALGEINIGDSGKHIIMNGEGLEIFNNSGYATNIVSTGNVGIYGQDDYLVMNSGILLHSDYNFIEITSPVSSKMTGGENYLFVDPYNIRLGNYASYLSFFDAAGASQSTGWSTNNYSTDTNFDASSTSLGEIADVLSTLIETLKGYGLLGS